MERDTSKEGVEFKSFLLPQLSKRNVAARRREKGRYTRHGARAKKVRALNAHFHPASEKEGEGGGRRQKTGREKL